LTKHVVVVGGGVVGLASAYFLRREGAEVTLLERSTIGSGASWGNSGWVDPTFSAPLAGPGMVGTALRALARPNGSFYLPMRHLPRLAPWLWRFWRASSPERHDAGLRAVARLAQPTQRLYDQLGADGVRFDSRRLGVVHAFLDAARAERIHQTFLPLTELGYEAPSGVVGGAALREGEPSLSEAVAGGFIVEGARVVNSPSLLYGLQARITELGGAVREHAPVIGLDTKGSRVTGVRTPEGPIEADEVVLAAGVWTGQLAAKLGIDVRIEAGKGYSFSVTPMTMTSHLLHLYEARIAVSPFEERLRIAGTMELSGVNRKLNPRRIAKVAQAASRYLGGWTGPLEEQWTGLRPLTPDGLPVLGRPREWTGLCMASGHAMAGVMLAPATGQAIAQIVLEDADLAELHPFNPDRFG
jgi:D-amino-acid dehydrogenase